MTEIRKNALVMYTPDKIYRLVNEVEHYPEFLPWCRSSQVLERDRYSQHARLEIATGPLNKSFSTRNAMEPDRQILLQLDEGPFRKLHGEWQFIPLGNKGCKIILEIEFEFAGGMMAAVLSPVFSEICSSLVDAFVKRADQVYRD